LPRSKTQLSIGDSRFHGNPVVEGVRRDPVGPFCENRDVVYLEVEAEAFGPFDGLLDQLNFPETEPEKWKEALKLS